MATASPPDHLRARLRQTMDPLPIWYPTFTDAATDPTEYPLHALTQRPMAHYHSWGSQNAWLRQIHGHTPLYVSGEIWAQHGFQQGDWAILTSPHGRITLPVVRMDALNGRTVWTWNAIAKRRGAWALDDDAPEATKSQLLNHLIHELLPPKGDGLRWANSDPVTGQAAWYDLRVRIEKAPAGQSVAYPDTGHQDSPVAPAPRNLAHVVKD